MIDEDVRIGESGCRKWIKHFITFFYIIVIGNSLYSNRSDNRTMSDKLLSYRNSVSCLAFGSFECESEDGGGDYFDNISSFNNSSFNLFSRESFS